MKANSVNVLLRHENSKLALWMNACRMDYFGKGTQQVS